MAVGVAPAGGRGDALTRAQGALSRRGCALVGPPGIGKTYTARQLAEGAGSRGEVVWLAGTAAASDVPLGALAGFLPDDPDADQPAIVLARTALTQRAAGRPLLLVVDDAHWLDEASATLVRLLALGGEATLLVTQRSGVPAPDPIVRLWRDDLVERIDLDGLDLAAIAELTAELLGAAVDPRSAEAVWARSGGNPLFARELVLAARAAGEWVLGLDGLRWQAGTAAAPQLSELLGERVAALPDTHRQALAHLAFGEPLTLEELSRIASEPVIDDLERDGLLSVTADGAHVRISCAHPLHAEILRRSTSPLRARVIRATLANVLAAVLAETPADGSPEHHRAGDDLRLATLAIDAGVDVAAAVLARAAGVALLGGDGDLAVRLADEAHRKEPTFATGRLLADALVRFGALDDARLHWDDWAALATTDEERRQIELHRAAGELRRGGDTGQALGVLADDRALRADLLNLSGHYTEALAIAEPGSLNAAVALNGLGRSGESLAITERQDQSDLHWATGRAAALLNHGRFLDAAEALERVAAAARQIGDRTAEALAERMRADALGILGRHDEALTAIAAAEGAVVRRDQAAHLARALAVRAWLASCRGDAAGAGAALARLDTLAVPAGTPVSWAAIARAWLAHLDGDPDAAAGLAREAAELASIGAVLGALRTLRAAAHLAGTPVDPQAQALAARCDGPFAAALAATETAGLLTLGATGVVEWPAGATAEPPPAPVPLAPLSRREREVALLAAQGLPARTIGERLFLSARTVENHLNRAYDKLGIRSRAELAQLLAAT